jgi:hypothetical protein
MGRFNRIDEGGNYSDMKPERCTPAIGAAFLLPGETKPRRLGEDPDMPPASGLRHYERPINLGFAHLKGARR